MAEPVAYPRVSVVIPTLNRGAFLGPTIESVLNQDYPHLECIVVDGGSSDGSLEILRAYGDRIRWVSGPDKGHADAINKGWALGRGDILAWLNADDIYVASDAVRQAVTFLEAHPDADVIYGDYVEVDVKGRIASERIRPGQWDLLTAVLECDHIIPQASSFIRRRALEKVGWLDPTLHYCKDHELWLRIGLVGIIQHAPILIAGVRRVPGLSQHLATSHAKVRLTKMFLAQGGLPRPLSEPRFQRMALSNAYLVGGLYALANRHTTAAGGYFLKAVRQEPRNFPYVVYRVLQYLASLTVPVGARRAARRLLERLGVISWMRRLHEFN